MRAADTSASAVRAQRLALRSLGSEGRLAAALEMSDEMRQTVEDGVRARAPNASEADVQRTVLRLMYGERLERAVSAARHS
jgi:hypothetical protein